MTFFDVAMYCHEYIENNEMPDEFWTELARREMLSYDKDNYESFYNYFQTTIDYMAEHDMGGELAIMIKFYSKNVKDLVESRNLWMLDKSWLPMIVDRVENENEKIIADMKKNPKAINALMGKVMKVSSGRFNHTIVLDYLKERYGEKHYAQYEKTT